MTAAERNSMRRCVGCGASMPKQELVRFVVSPQNELTVDIFENLPGRGAHCFPALACLKAAAKKNRFSSAFKRSIRAPAPEQMHSIVAQGLEDRVLQIASGARKAGLLDLGADAVAAALEKAEDKAAVIIAADASEGTKRKIDKACCKIGVEPWLGPEMEQLGRRVGAKRVAACAVTAAGLVDKLNLAIKLSRAARGQLAPPCQEE